LGDPLLDGVTVLGHRVLSSYLIGDCIGGRAGSQIGKAVRWWLPHI
jgi:hypothetical protein